MRRCDLWSRRLLSAVNHPHNSLTSPVPCDTIRTTNLLWIMSISLHAMLFLN
jgi:hypothetical protein